GAGTAIAHFAFEPLGGFVDEVRRAVRHVLVRRRDEPLYGLFEPFDRALKLAARISVAHVVTIAHGFTFEYSVADSRPRQPGVSSSRIAASVSMRSAMRSARACSRSRACRSSSASSLRERCLLR